MNLIEQRNYCLNLMKTVKACFLSTINQSGFPEIRAMLNLRNSGVYPKLSEVFEKHDEDFLVYLTTNSASQKVRQINNNSHISIYYCDPDVFQGTMIAGKAEIVDDIFLKKELWQADWNVYYPGGPNDPDYTIIRFKPDYVKAYGNLNTFTINLKKK